MDNLKRAAEARMKKSITALESELGRIRTGRANAGLLDHIMVDYYGAKTPLNQVCSIAVEGASTLVLSVWEKQMVESVEKSIQESDLGLNPAVSGTTVRIPMPALTEERRKELVKIIRQHGESAKVAIRNIRREFNQQLKNELKKKEISKDDEKKLEAGIQKVTDVCIATAEEVLAAKEKELMEI